MHLLLRLFRVRFWTATLCGLSGISCLLFVPANGFTAETAAITEQTLAIVKTDAAFITDGKDILGSAPQGTRLFVFSKKDNLAEVKVPESEQHGWIELDLLKPFTVSDEDRKKLAAANDLYEKFQKQTDAKQLAEASQTAEAMLAVHQPIMGKHTQVAKDLIMIGMNTKDYKTAIARFQEALDIDQELLGLENPYSRGCVQMMGELQMQHGENEAAQKNFELLLPLQRKALGNDDFEVGKTLAKLGDLARANKDFPVAHKYLLEGLPLFRKRYGDISFEAGTIVKMLGVVADEQHDLALARKYFEEGLAIDRKVADHPRMTDTLFKLGQLCESLKDYPNARKYYAECYEIRSRDLGKDHAETREVEVRLKELKKLESTKPRKNKQ